MIQFDLPKFVLTGELGPIHRRLSRSEIEAHLGAPTFDNGQIVNYGNIGVEYGEREGVAVCGIQIGFPHPSQAMCEFDSRYDWNFGVVGPSATIENAVELLQGFAPIEFIDPNSNYTVFEHPDSLVHVSFLTMNDCEPQTITNINAVPWWNGG